MASGPTPGPGAAKPVNAPAGAPDPRAVPGSQIVSPAAAPTGREALKRDATDARDAVVDAAGELGAALSDARDEAIAGARKYAPWAAGAIGTLIVLRIAGAVRRRRRSG